MGSRLASFAHHRLGGSERFRLRVGDYSNHLHIQPGAKQDPSPRDRTSSGNLSPSDFCPWLFPLSALPLALSALPLALLGAPSCHGVDGSLARRRQLSTPTVVTSRRSTFNLSHSCPWSGRPWLVVVFARFALGSSRFAPSFCPADSTISCVGPTSTSAIPMPIEQA